MRCVYVKPILLGENSFYVGYKKKLVATAESSDLSSKFKRRTVIQYAGGMKRQQNNELLGLLEIDSAQHCIFFRRRSCCITSQVQIEKI